ncbi:MAG: MBL fold metallo-hydrolase [Terrimicrobiaceae bacterium]
MKTLLPGVMALPDGCNVYALVEGRHALLFDFGRGKILPHLRRHGVRTIDAILLTHPHADQIAVRPPPGIPVYASAEAESHLTLRGVRAFSRRPSASPVPENFLPLPSGLPNVHCSLGPGREFFWRDRLIRIIPTPGHTKAAVTFLVEWNGRHLAFCGDAVLAPGLLWQPHHLEWDHWSTAGGRAALWGLDRLRGLAIDALLPSHGEPELRAPQRVLGTARKKLLRWIALRENIAAGSRVQWLAGKRHSESLSSILPHLHRFGANGIILGSENGEALVWDLMPEDVKRLPAVLKKLGLRRVDAASATHYHDDHAGGLETLRARRGAKILLPTGLAAILAEPERFELPFRPDRLMRPPDKILRRNRVWRWNEYAIQTWFFPGQTEQHYAFAVEVDGRRVLLSGDNFFPPDRWGGSGGCSGYNQSRPWHFASSARQVLAWKPDILCGGHQATFAFSARYFHKVIAWAKAYEDACVLLGYPPTATP